MEPGDITDVAKAGGNSVAGFTIGHLTGNDWVVILTLIYLTGQIIVLTPKIIATIRNFINKVKRNGESNTGGTE